MKEIIGLAVLASTLLDAGLGLGFYGLLKRKKQMLYLAALSVLLCLLVAGWTAYRTFYKSYRHVAEAIRPRNGAEIYTALFGDARPGCVHIINYQDQVVPRIDYAIWLQYRTCPQELKRVLARHPFERRVTVTASLTTLVPNGEEVAWFRPKLLGDTVITYEYTTPNGRNCCRFWTSPDSASVFYQDILD